MPAFAPVLRSLDEALSSVADVEIAGVEFAGVEIAGVEVDNAEIDNAEVDDLEIEEKETADGTVDVKPTVAASSKRFFLSPQQVLSPQHHFFPPQFRTPTLPH